jgi:hypothetical protein
MTLRAPSEQGIALLMTVMVLLLLSALAVALVLTSSIETGISANYRRSIEALFAAEAGLDRAVSDLRACSDWNGILQGLSTSTFVDGPDTGVRMRPDGGSIDLSRLTNLANCNRPTACTDAELNEVTAIRPWGANNPRWRLYAWGPLSALLPPGSARSLFYVVVWVADDPSETDGDPLRDGGATAATDGGGTVMAGAGLLLVRAEAFGPAGARRALEATVARSQPSDVSASSAPVRIVVWRELR